MLLEQSALAGPGISIFSGRIVEPIACVMKARAQSGKGGVAGIVVAIEAGVGVLRSADGGNGEEHEGRERARQSLH